MFGLLLLLSVLLHGVIAVRRWCSLAVENQEAQIDKTVL